MLRNGSALTLFIFIKFYKYKYEILLKEMNIDWMQ